MTSRLPAWIDRYQVYIGTPAAGSGVATACAELAALAAAVPQGLAAAERAIVRRLLNRAWDRVLAGVGCGVPGPRGAWGGDEPSRADAGADAEVSDGRVDPRVMRAVAAIDTRFAEPGFRLQTLARELAVSPTHLTQLLKQHTGRTFGGHVHGRRLAEARALLSQSTLSIKEVAGRVGYTTTSQLDRHFRRSARCSPSAFRDQCGGIRSSRSAIAPADRRMRG